MRIGIPRSLLYFNYAPLWQNFFSELGATVVVSPPTNKEILNRGVEIATDDTCLPVKLFYGHVAALAGQVDYLFIPQVRSVENRRYLCPKIIGLPNLIRFSGLELPPLLEVRVDASRNAAGVKEAYVELGVKLIGDRARAEAAYEKGRQLQEHYERLIFEGWMPWRALAAIAGEESSPSPPADLRIAVISHAYLIQEPFISMGLLGRLEAMGVTPLLSEKLTPQEVENGTRHVGKDLFWTYGKKLMAAGKVFFEMPGVDGVIFLTSFGCGSDSIVEPFITHGATKEVPLLILTVDEHTGEAGMVTRLEAFLDMIRRRRRKSESRLSAHG